jgi:hypothetical protein
MGRPAPAPKNPKKCVPEARGVEVQPLRRLDPFPEDGMEARGGGVAAEVRAELEAFQRQDRGLVRSGAVGEVVETLDLRRRLAAPAVGERSEDEPVEDPAGGIEGGGQAGARRQERRGDQADPSALLS